MCLSIVWPFIIMISYLTLLDINVQAELCTTEETQSVAKHTAGPAFLHCSQNDGNAFAVLFSTKSNLVGLEITDLQIQETLCAIDTCQTVFRFLASCGTLPSCDINYSSDPENPHLQNMKLLAQRITLACVQSGFVLEPSQNKLVKPIDLSLLTEQPSV